MTRVLTANLCARHGHPKCPGFERADPKKHEITESQEGEMIFCVCSCHKKPRKGESGSRFPLPAASVSNPALRHSVLQRSGLVWQRSDWSCGATLC